MKEINCMKIPSADRTRITTKREQSEVLTTKPTERHSEVSTLHSQFVQYGKNAREWMRKCEMLLPHIQRYEIWRKKGYTSIYHYAAVLAGMNHEKVDEVLRVLKKIEDKTQLMKIAESKGIQAVRPIASIATTETQSFWAEKAENMSKNTLEIYVKEWKKAYGKPNINEGIPQKILPREEMKVKKVVGMDLEIEIISELEKLKGPGDWNTLMKEFLELRKEKLEAEKPEKVRVVVKSAKVLSVSTNCKPPSSEDSTSPTPKPYHSRQAPAKIQKYILKRTNGQCAFPSCNKPHKLKHHTNRYALIQEHDPDTYFPLCFEHERLAHLGLIENEEKDPSTWRIRTEADTTSPKYKIDQKVQEYRRIRNSKHGK